MNYKKRLNAEYSDDQKKLCMLKCVLSFYQLNQKLPGEIISNGQNIIILDFEELFKGNLGLLKINVYA